MIGGSGQLECGCVCKVPADEQSEHAKVLQVGVKAPARSLAV